MRNRRIAEVHETRLRNAIVFMIGLAGLMLALHANLLHRAEKLETENERLRDACGVR